MLISRTRAIALLMVAFVGTASGHQATKQFPPGLQAVKPESPVLSPEEEMKTFFMPPGYHVELVASEPMIMDPILIDFDADGRMWAIELPGYMPEINPSDALEREPTGRIVVLEDTNNDGKMDKRTVFKDGLILPRALKVLDHGVLVGEPPNVWLFKDTNGDLKADTKELVTNTFGRMESSVEHNANSLFWGMDNWLYTSEVDTQVRLKDNKFEAVKTLSRGQWGATQDDAGRIYRNTNESVLHVDVVPTRYYTRHPTLLRTRGSYESLEGDSNEVNATWPVRPTTGVNRGYQSGVLRADGTLANHTSVCSPIVYRGDRLPAELYGNVFVAEPAANLVSRIIVDTTGPELKPSKAYQGGEFLASTDERFRPVYLAPAPDGTFYIVDIYRGIIQHKIYITEYLKGQIDSRNLTLPTGKGRIYRVVHDTTKRDVKPELSKASPAKLVQTLSHPNGWWRDTAQRLLVERGDPKAVAPLTTLANGAKDWKTRLHALWTLDGTDKITQALVIKALNDPVREVRLSGVRLAERWLGTPDPAVLAAVVKRVDDPEPMVRRQAAASLGALAVGVREAPIASMLEKHGDDPITVDASISGLRGSETVVLETLLKSKTETPPLSASITMLAATVVRGAQDAGVQTILQWISDDARPTWQRSALLRGGEVALLNSTMPGTIARGRGAAPAAADPPCPTCPGARAGPGGASAFGAANRAGGAGRGAAAAAPAPEVAAAVPAAPAGRGGGGGGGGRGGGGAPLTRLRREPALVAFAERDKGDLGTRATALLARLEWPGKPGAAAPVAPLTPAEEQRFAAGEQIYLNICKACHQVDGRGMDKVAPPLVGSAFALGPAAVTSRILLNGKEGTVGLMPPLGAALTDDQIASVLTYIRREWGHTATPVDPATVKDARALVAGRARPWSNDELTALMNGGRGGQ